MILSDRCIDAFLISKNVLSTGSSSTSGGGRVMDSGRLNKNNNRWWRRYGLDFDEIGKDDQCELGDGFINTCMEEGEDNINEEIPLSLKKKNIILASCREELPKANSDLTPEEVVQICMEYLQNNHIPVMNSGLEVCFEFSSDRCRAANGGSLEQFVTRAANPTFQSMIDTLHWDIVTIGPEIPGGPTRGPMKTVLVQVTPKQSSEQLNNNNNKNNNNNNNRRFLWTLQRERRPPRQGFWLVHECIFVDMAFALTE